MNTTLFNLFITLYNQFSFTHNYIFGFEYKGLVYMTIALSDILPYILCLDKASRGAGYALRFKPTTSQKMLLMKNAEVLCSTDFLKNEVVNSKYNTGEIFEKMITEHFGQVWKKDNIPFTKDGDITVNGVAYQIKFQKATFATEKQLVKLQAK